VLRLPSLLSTISQSDTEEEQMQTNYFLRGEIQALIAPSARGLDLPEGNWTTMAFAMWTVFQRRSRWAPDS